MRLTTNWTDFITITITTSANKGTAVHAFHSFMTYYDTLSFMPN